MRLARRAEVPLHELLSSVDDRFHRCVRRDAVEDHAEEAPAERRIQMRGSPEINQVRSRLADSRNRPQDRLAVRDERHRRDILVRFDAQHDLYLATRWFPSPHLDDKCPRGGGECRTARHDESPERHAE